MEEKVLCCPNCGDDLLMEQRAMLRESNFVEGYCALCCCHIRLDKAVWKGVDIES